MAGPGSPPAVAIASLSRSLGISTDTLLLGDLDARIDLACTFAFAFAFAFDASARRLKDIKADAELAAAFAGCTLGSDTFADFVRNVAFDRVGGFRRAFNAARRDQHPGNLISVTLQVVRRLPNTRGSRRSPAD